MVLGHRWLGGLILLTLVSRVLGGECGDDCVPVGQWQVNVGVGLGWRNNPLHEGEDSPMFVLPEISYYGERFFLKNLEMGWNIVEDRRHQLNFLLTPSSDQMHFNRWDPYNFFDFNSAGPSSSGTPSAPLSVNLVVDNELASAAGAEPGPALEFSDVNYLRVNDRVVSFTPIDQSSIEQDQPVRAVNDGDSWALTELSEGDRIGVAYGANDNIPGNSAVYREYIVTDGRLQQAITTQWAPPDIARANIEGDANKTAATDVRPRRTAALAGLEYLYSNAHFAFHTQLLSDISGVHDGQELRLAAIFPWEMLSSQWAITYGVSYKSQSILDYYYGVDSKDTDSAALLFQPQTAGLAQMFRLDWQKPLSRKWSLRAMLQYTRLPTEVQGSPLVADQAMTAFFFGGVYHF